MDLPLFSRNRQNPRIKAKQTERQALEADIENLRRQHAAMIEADLARYRRLERALERQQQELLPLAQEKLELLTALWRSNEGGLNEVVSAQAQLLDAQMEFIELQQKINMLGVVLHLTYNSHEVEQRLLENLQ